MMERSEPSAPQPSNASRVLVVAATPRELEPLGQRVGGERAESGDKILFRGRVGAHEVVAAQTGVGKCNASLETLELLRRAPCRLVVSTGCAGGFPSGGLQIGDVVVADEVILGDEGAWSQDGFLDLEALGLPLARTADDQPIYNRLRTDLGAVVQSSPPIDLAFGVRVGPISTVSTCSGTARRAEEMWNRWRPLAEAMEGAAVALAARRYRCPFIEVRGISNLVGPRDRQAWEIDLACEHAAHVVEELIRGL